MSTHGRGHSSGFGFEASQHVSEIDALGIHDDVQERYRGASIVRRLRQQLVMTTRTRHDSYLICEPYILAALGRFCDLVFHVLIKKYQPVYGATSSPGQNNAVSEGGTTGLAEED